MTSSAAVRTVAEVDQRQRDGVLVAPVDGGVDVAQAAAEQPGERVAADDPGDGGRDDRARGDQVRVGPQDHVVGDAVGDHGPHVRVLERGRRAVGEPVGIAQHSRRVPGQHRDDEQDAGRRHQDPRHIGGSCHAARRLALVDLHPDEVVVFEGHPSWRAVLSFYIGGVGGALVIAVIVALVADVFLAVVAAVVLIALVVLAGLIKRTATDYMVTNQRLYIRRGILSKKVQQTRIDRVQNVNTDQRFRDRILRVGTIDFDTAGTDDSEFRFVGISDPAKVAAAVDQAQREANLKGQTL